MNILRDLSFARRNAPRSVESVADSTTYDQKPWNLLYKAIVDSTGTSPNNFQLLYPFASWNWPTQSVGFLSAQQYDFCAIVPQWSAVGAYVSSGDKFNQAYEQFLNVIVPQTEDPVLRKKITKSERVLTDATNAYTTAYTQAQSVYLDTAGGKDNKPSFTEWLGTAPGKGWQTKITSTETRMNQAQLNYNALVAQANTPGLSNAQAQFKNVDFYSKLTNSGLQNFPKVPLWSVSQNPGAWVDAIKAGDGPAGATMGFTNRDSSYDFSKTWAGGSVSVSEFFWSVNLSGSWERITEFESDQELAVSIQFEAFDLITVQPADWYNGPFVKSMADGPFIHGYSPYGGDGNKPIFGEKGFIGLLKTGMYVIYKPTFTITTSASTFKSFVEKFKSAIGIRIGPVTIDADGGIESSQWSYSEAGRSFSGTSTSEAPLILGVTIARLPTQVDAMDLLTADANDEPRGQAYRFEDYAGDVLAAGVAEAEARALGARSWKASRTIGPVPLKDKVIHVRWNKKGAENDTFLSGTITVQTAVAVGFAVFVLSGVYFSVQKITGGTTVDFTYNGTQSAEFIKSLLVAGAEVIFQQKKGSSEV